MAYKQRPKNDLRPMSNSVINANMAVKREENEQLQPAAGPATLLLTRVSGGDSAAVAELLPLVYDQDGFPGYGSIPWFQ